LDVWPLSGGSFREEVRFGWTSAPPQVLGGPLD